MLAAGMAVAPASADAPSDLRGAFVAIDVEGSFWQVSFSASGRFNGIDSGTLPCQGHRTRTWGALEEVTNNEFVATSFNAQCLQGPLKGTVFNFGPGWHLIYDPVEDTILTPNEDPYRDVTFCRRPCDPYDYVP
jgi:hypothetical protein